jgi:hypothetical protein
MLLGTTEAAAITVAKRAAEQLLINISSCCCCPATAAALLLAPGLAAQCWLLLGCWHCEALILQRQPRTLRMGM